MHLHWLQHVPFEGLGSIADWAAGAGHRVSCTRFWADEALPRPDSLDMLVVMGGPMGVHDEHLHPWLAAEKAFIRGALEADRVVLGICLGAQLLATVCGAEVYRNRDREIGWHRVVREATAPDWVAALFPPELMTFHWHGDTFDIPAGGQPLCASAACRNQGFVVGERLMALQFHPEMSAAGITALVENCGAELVPAAWVQSERQILEGSGWIEAANRVMDRLLDHCAGRAAKP